MPSCVSFLIRVGIAAAIVACASCTTGQRQEPPPPPTGPGPLTSPSPSDPPEVGPAASPLPGSAPPARAPRIDSVEDIPPPSAAQGRGAPFSAADAPSAPPAKGLREVFPHIRIDPEAKIVEFDGAVAWDVHDPQTPMTFLELVVCTPNTKEYESLVVSPARPSNVHAALLLLGLEPGKPGTYVWEDDKVKPVDPQGPPLHVSFILNAGSADEQTVDPRTWIVNAQTKETFGSDAPTPAGSNGWVFAGSRTVRRDVGHGEQDFYLADGDDGSLIGLTTFGSETIAWHRTISPDSGVTEPEWIANVPAMPRIGTPVVVRIHAAAAQPAPAGDSH